MEAANGSYGISPWMRPEVRLGDDVDPSPLLDGESMVAQMVALNQPAPPAGYTPRLLGYERPELGILDVLDVGPNTLMQDTPTRQDSGMQGTLRPATGAW